MAELKYGFIETVQRLRGDKKALLTVALGILGMLLVLFSELPMFSGEKEQSAGDDTAYFDRNLEKETEKLISEIRGVGEVSVMLTYESSEETVWAKDDDSQVNGNGESDISNKHIIIDDDNGENGLAVKVIYPKVRGVAVVCTGGDDPTVKSEIKALLSALFDIGSNRISIARGADKE